MSELTPRPVDQPLTRRIDAAARDVAADVGRIAYTYPRLTSVGAGLVIVDVAAAIPGVRAIDLFVGVAGGLVAHRYITKFSKASERAALEASQGHTCPGA